VWQSLADANVDTDGHSYGNSNCYSNGNRDRAATTYTDATASTDTAATRVIC
jgi:hypothetical protein